MRASKSCRWACMSGMPNVAPVLLESQVLVAQQRHDLGQIELLVVIGTTNV